MGRAARYSDQDILDTALDIIAEEGIPAATAIAIAQRLGAPSGSIYHRFASRDLILATLWIRTVQRFQQGFLDALSDQDLATAAGRAVAHTVGRVTTHRSEATVLALYRREDLIALWPDELGDELATLNDDVKAAVVRFTTAHFGIADRETLGKAQFALIDLPLAAVRRAIRSDRPIPWLTETVLAASKAVLAT